MSLAERRPDGACVFLETSRSPELCVIHRRGGQALLPVTCRMFPRVALHDARGWALSLSHYCPTAASLLFEASGPVTIVDAPPALSDVGPLDGLQAAEAIPPLLREGVMMDLDSFAEWESGAVGVLTASGTTPDAAVADLETVTRAVAAWAPGSRLLLDAVRAAFATPRAAQRCDTPRPLARPLSPAAASAVQRWLAAHLFGNWIAYQGRGLLTMVRYVQACLDVFTIELARDGNALEAIRRSDFLIVHECESQQLANALEALLRRERGSER